MRLPYRLRARGGLPAWRSRCRGALLLVQSAAIAWLVQAVLVQHLALAQLRNVGAGLLVALIGRALLNAWAQALVGTVADVARRELRARIARRLVQHGPLWLRRQRSGELGELSLAHTDALEGYFVGYQFARTEMLLVPPLILIAVFSVDWVVGLVLLLTAPLIPFFMMLVGWGAEAAGREQLGELARMGGHFADRLKGLGCCASMAAARLSCRALPPRPRACASVR